LDWEGFDLDFFRRASGLVQQENQADEKYRCGSRKAKSNCGSKPKHFVAAAYHDRYAQ